MLSLLKKDICDGSYIKIYSFFIFICLIIIGIIYYSHFNNLILYDATNSDPENKENLISELKKLKKDITWYTVFISVVGFILTTSVTSKILLNCGCNMPEQLTGLTGSLHNLIKTIGEEKVAPLMYKKQMYEL